MGKFTSSERRHIMGKFLSAVLLLSACTLPLVSCESGRGSTDCKLACEKIIQCFTQECAVDPKPECNQLPSQSECERVCAADANPGCTEKHCQVDENDPWKWNNECVIAVECSNLGDCE